MLSAGHSVNEKDGYSYVYDRLRQMTSCIKSHYFQVRMLWFAIILQNSLFQKTFQVLLSSAHEKMMITKACCSGTSSIRTN